MKMKLTTLCENTASSAGIVAEWGWSIFVETDDMNILFDTGGGNAAVRNARTHLYPKKEDQVEKTVQDLKELDVQKLGLCHCTDLPAASLMAQEFGESFFFNNAGTSIDLP